MSGERYIYALTGWTVEKRAKGWYFAPWPIATTMATGAVRTAPKPALRRMVTAVRTSCNAGAAAEKQKAVDLMDNAVALPTTRVGSGKRGGYLIELQSRSDRIGVAVDDPDQVRPVRVAELAGHLHGDPLARSRREPVNIADQGYHDPSPRYCRSARLSSRTRVRE
jgi:hypothetical protein